MFTKGLRFKKPVFIVEPACCHSNLTSVPTHSEKNRPSAYKGESIYCMQVLGHRVSVPSLLPLVLTGTATLTPSSSSLLSPFPFFLSLHFSCHWTASIGFIPPSEWLITNGERCWRNDGQVGWATESNAISIATYSPQPVDTRQYLVKRKKKKKNGRERKKIWNWVGQRWHSNEVMTSYILYIR